MTDTFKKDDVVIFLGYSDPDAEGFEAILEEGSRLRVGKPTENGGIEVFLIDEKGNYVADENDNMIGEEVYLDEIKLEAPKKAARKSPAKKAAKKAKPAVPPVVEDVVAAEPEEPEVAEVEPEVEEEPAKPAKKAAKKSAKKAPAKKAAKKAAKVAEEVEEVEEDEEVYEAPVASPLAKPTGEIPVESMDALAVAVQDTESVKALLENQSALDAAEMLVQRAEETDFNLGGVLHHILANEAYKELGFEGKGAFKRYCHEHLAFEYRKARYLIKNYVTLMQVAEITGYDVERGIANVGWSKVKEIARVGVQPLANDWEAITTAAKEMSRDELVTHIDEKYKVLKNADKTKYIKFAFTLHGEEAERAKIAIEHAKTLAQTGEDNAAFAYIIFDWMNTAEASDVTIDKLIDLAALQGVTLVDLDEYSAQQAETEAAE